MRVNLGCGQAYMEGWVNVDASPDVKADIYLDVAEFVRQYGDQVDEVYMGHVIEHLLPGYALTTLRLLNERLRPGAVVSAVTPDMAAIFDAYKAGEISNDQLNASFIYSYVQPSPHVWCYDPASLTELFRRAGFKDIEEIDPLTWDPVYWKEGPESRWQCGVKAAAGGHSLDEAQLYADAVARTPELAELDEAMDVATASAAASTTEQPVTPEALLLERVEHLRTQLIREFDRRVAAERQVAQAPAPAPAIAPIGWGDEGAQPVGPPGPGVAVTGPPPKGLKARIRYEGQRRLPHGSKKRALAKASLLTYRDSVELTRRTRRNFTATGALEPSEPSYHAWYKDNDASPADLQAQRDRSEAARTPLTVLVCVLVHGLPDARSVSESLKSLSAQSWAHWTAVVCGPAGTPAPTQDSRVSLRVEDTTVTAAHHAMVGSDADYVVFLDEGDTLAPDCLYEVALQGWQDPLVDLVTWDDDLLAGSGRRHHPRFRPSWSPEQLLGMNYLGQSFAVRRARAVLAGGLRNGYGDAMPWDLLLRCGLDGERVARVPRVLGHLTRRKDKVDASSVRMINEHLVERGLQASAELGTSCVRLRWDLPEWPTVTVVIPTRHNRTMLSRLLPSLARTDYPSFEVRVIDNGGQSEDNERWYAANDNGLNLNVQWWTETPFNYSRVNNTCARGGSGEVLLFLNDDTEIVDPQWMRELAGWASQPEIGTAGLQLIGSDGAIQHAGAIVGMSGFADHVFEGMRPGSDTMFGPTDTYRDVLAVTAACMAIRREVFESIGGFDERFTLTGNDVALGLAAHLKGLRNICSPFGGVRHLESATRGTNVPTEDFFTSYWAYNTWLFGGDPYYSPNLSLGSRKPKLRSLTEPTPAQRIAGPIGRNLEAFRQTNDAAEARMLADNCRATELDVAGVEALHAANALPFDVRTINWYIPDIDSPFYGGINTALRMADYLKRNHGVENRFVVWGSPPDHFTRSAITAAFPSLADAQICFYDGAAGASLEKVPAADASIATLWVTAYAVAKAQNTKRKFYLVQDFEPMFYPASTLYALTEETYKLGLYGLCNTDNLRRIYADDYAGKGMSFTPAVDPTVFHAKNRKQRTPDAPVTVFVYARPGHWRNCWEMASLALEELKAQLGDRVRIVTAGSWAKGAAKEGTLKSLGLLNYRATGDLYRSCDVGLALTVSKHPSYLPLELMACGVPVVAFDNPWGHWILKDEENCLLAKRTVPSLTDKLARLVVDTELRNRLRNQAVADIAAAHGSWDGAFGDIYGYLCNPEGR